MALNDYQVKLIVESNNYLEGGTKEACLKLRQFDQSDKTSLGDEEINAIRVLVAASFGKDDEIPKRWLCDSDCHHVGLILCRGEMNIDSKAVAMCPYFSDDSDW